MDVMTRDEFLKGMKDLIAINADVLAQRDTIMNKISEKETELKANIDKDWDNENPEMVAIQAEFDAFIKQAQAPLDTIIQAKHELELKLFGTKEGQQFGLVDLAVVVVNILEHLGVVTLPEPEVAGE